MIDPNLCQAEVMKKVYANPGKSSHQVWRACQCKHARAIPGVDFCTLHLNRYRHGSPVRKVKS